MAEANPASRSGTVFLKNALLDDGRKVDLEVIDGRVAAHHPPGKVPPENMADEEESLEGFLVLPAMAEPHAHLDKALTASRISNPAGDLMGAISAWSEERKNISEEDYISRACQAVELSLLNGATAIRTHIDVGADIGARSVSVLNAVKEEMKELADIQVVALPSSPITGREGEANREALFAAMEAGADLVGGVPAIDTNPKDHIEICLKLADEIQAGADLHIDETLDLKTLTLRELVRKAGEFQVPITASHCVSLGMQKLPLQKKLAAEVYEAGVGVVTLPQTNLFLQARGVTSAPPRGLTAVAALVDAGALLAAGGDNLQDPFNLMGRGDPLETAGLMVSAGHLEPEQAFEMVSRTAFKVMGLEPGGPEVGQRADLFCVKAEDIRSAIAFCPASRRTYRAGKLVAATSQERWLASQT